MDQGYAGRETLSGRAAETDCAVRRTSCEKDTTAHGVIPTKGYLFVALAALLWAVSGSSAKLLFQHGMTPLQLVQARLTLGLALLIVWFALKRPDLLKISPRDIPYFALLGTAGLAMVNFTYLLAISKIQVAAAILLEYLAPLFIALYSLVFAGERPTRLTTLAMTGAAIGCYFVVGGYNFDLLALNRDGLIAGVCSAVAYAFYTLQGEYGMRRYKPWTVLFYSVVFAALFWNVAHFAWSGAPAPFESLRKPYSPTEWALIVYIGVFGTMVPFGLYFEGINLIRATRASITATLEPIIAAAVSYFFLNEILEAFQMLGGLLVIGSVVLLQARKEYDDRTPALIRSRSQEER